VASGKLIELSARAGQQLRHELSNAGYSRWRECHRAFLEASVLLPGRGFEGLFLGFDALDATAQTPALGSMAGGLAFGAIASGPESKRIEAAGDSSRLQLPSRRASGSVEAAVFQAVLDAPAVARGSASPAPADANELASPSRMVCIAIAAASASTRAGHLPGAHLHLGGPPRRWVRAE